MNKEEINAWLQNSKEITKVAKEPYKSSFEYELNLRRQIVASDQFENYQVNPETTIGNYKIIGKNPDRKNSCYIGNLLIEFENNMWFATWFIYGEAHTAYGMQVTSNMLVFNFSYVNTNKKVHTGLVAYKFLSKTIVHGEWVEEGFPLKGIEELRKTDTDNETFMEDHGFDENFGFSLN